MKKSTNDKVTSLLDQIVYEARMDALDTIKVRQIEKCDAIHQVLKNGYGVLQTTSGDRLHRLLRQRQKLYIKMKTLSQVIIEIINLKKIS